MSENINNNTEDQLIEDQEQSTEENGKRKINYGNLLIITISIAALIIGILSIYFILNIKRDIQSFEADINQDISHANINRTNLNAEVNDIGYRVDILEILVEGMDESPAYLDPSAPNSGYQILRNNHGIFLITLTGLEPYLDGYEVNLTIGNLSNARFDGFDIMAEWGEHYGISKLNSKTIPSTEKLYPGSWNEIKLVLTPVEDEKFDFIKIELITNSLSLVN